MTAQKTAVLSRIKIEASALLHSQLEVQTSFPKALDINFESLNCFHL